MAKYEITLEVETVLSEYGCCVTQLCNKLGKDASSFLQMIQTSKRIG